MIISGKYQKPQTVVCCKERERLKALTVACNSGKAGNFLKNSQMNQALIGVSTKTEHLMLFVFVLEHSENW